jgi:hypothetical protein
MQAGFGLLTVTDPQDIAFIDGWAIDSARASVQKA